MFRTFNIHFPLLYSSLYACQVVKSLGSEDLFEAPGSPSEEVIAQETEAAKAIIQDSRLRKVRGLLKDVVCLGWPIAPLYMNPNAEGGGVLLGQPMST